MSKNTLVLFHNAFNEADLTGFSGNELKSLFYVMVLLKDKKTNLIKIDLHDFLIKSFYSRNSRDIASMIKDLNMTFDKAKKLTVNHQGKKITIFNTLHINPNSREIFIQITENACFLFNRLTGNFSGFDFTMFAQVKSKYSRRIIPHLSQFKFLGKYTVTLERLREILCVPANHSISQFNQHVVNVLVTELSEYFENLSFITIRKLAKIHSYEFTFTPHKRKHNKKEIKKAGTAETFAHPIAGEIPAQETAPPSEMPTRYAEDERIAQVAFESLVQQYSQHEEIFAYLDD